MKYWFPFLAVLLVITNGFWIYTFADSAATKMYSDASFEATEKMYKQLVILTNLELIGKSADEAMKLIGKDVYGFDTFVKDGCVYAGQVCVRLNEYNTVVGFGENAL